MKEKKKVILAGEQSSDSTLIKREEEEEKSQFDILQKVFSCWDVNRPADVERKLSQLGGTIIKKTTKKKKRERVLPPLKGVMHWTFSWPGDMTLRGTAKVFQPRQLGWWDLKAERVQKQSTGECLLFFLGGGPSRPNTATENHTDDKLSSHLCVNPSFLGTSSLPMTTNTVCFAARDLKRKKKCWLPCAALELNFLHCTLGPNPS